MEKLSTLTKKITAMNNSFQTSKVLTAMLNTLTINTVKKVEEDVKKFSENHSDIPSSQIRQLFSNPEALKSMPEEIQDEINNILVAKLQTEGYLKEISNALSFLMAKCNIQFVEPNDSLSAFFACLPDYFSSETVLKSFQDYNNYPTDEMIKEITVKSYVQDSEFVKENKVSQEIEDKLMWFVGVQLLNDIF